MEQQIKAIPISNASTEHRLSKRLLRLTDILYDIYGGSEDDRRLESVRVRNVCSAVAHEAGLTYANIGRILGKNHSTVIHGVRTHYNDINFSDGYKEMYMRAKMLFSGGKEEDLIEMKEYITFLKYRLSQYEELYGDLDE